MIFISAKSTDYQYAEEIYRFLKSKGLNLFFSQESLPELASSDYRKQIDDALDSAQHMIVVTSSRANVTSSWVEAEWGLFINEKRSGRKVGNLITVVAGGLGPSELPPSLRYYEVIPFHRDSFQKILRYVSSGLNDPLSTSGDRAVPAVTTVVGNAESVARDTVNSLVHDPSAEATQSSESTEPQIPEPPVPSSLIETPEQSTNTNLSEDTLAVIPQTQEATTAPANPPIAFTDGGRLYRSESKIDAVLGAVPAAVGKALFVGFLGYVAAAPLLASVISSAKGLPRDEYLILQADLRIICGVAFMAIAFIATLVQKTIKK